ncbi:MAG: SCP2 sterol-binding domain-containing protein [Candidatus Thorarchaeota archaeon]
MDEDKITFLSDEWLQVYKKLLNVSEKYERVAKDWEGDFIFQIDTDDDNIQTPVRAYIDLYHGKMKDAYVAGSDDDAAFIWSGSLQNWKKLFAEEFGPIKGLLAGKFRLKGNYAKVLRYIRAATELMNVALKITTRFQDE